MVSTSRKILTWITAIKAGVRSTPCLEISPAQKQPQKQPQKHIWNEDDLREKRENILFMIIITMKKHNYILLLPAECIKYQLLYYCFKL